MSADLSQWRDQTPDAVWTELERLKAELARLTPSGQVAEDEGRAADGLFGHEEYCAAEHGGACQPPCCHYEPRQAVARLAAKAQGYEAMKAERDVALKSKALEEVCHAATEAQRVEVAIRRDRWKERCEAAERERDNARTSEAALRKRMEAAAEALGDVLPGECGRLDIVTRVKALKEERDAAVADSAALVKWINHYGHAEWCPQNHNDRLEGCHEACAAHSVFTESHPGAALLKEKQEQAETIRELVGALDDAMQAAFWGPREEKGGPGGESYSGWRNRVRDQCEAIARKHGRHP